MLAPTTTAPKPGSNTTHGENRGAPKTNVPENERPVKASNARRVRSNQQHQVPKSKMYSGSYNLIASVIQILEL